ncbi:hypothetical protein [Kitasatospora paranensis]|uniref:hypothetical protein n=1 Tax=Kitasatospora paranensis TaxID=258053 RepID=UPI0031EECE1F
MTTRPASRSARRPLIASASLLALAATLLLLPNGQPRGQAPLPVKPSTQPATSTSVQSVPTPAAQASRATSPAPAAPSTPGPHRPTCSPATCPTATCSKSSSRPSRPTSRPRRRSNSSPRPTRSSSPTSPARAAPPSSYFGGQTATAAWSHVRVQAGIARRHPGSSSQVDAHLVYAGTDPHGQAQERQTVTIVLAQAPGDGGWQPVGAP